MIKKSKAASTVEYMALIVFILGALFVFKRYIARGLWAQWKKAGDVFGHGRQFDPRPFGIDGEDGGTLRCMFVYDNPSNIYDSAGVWVDQVKYDECIINKDPNCALTWSNPPYVLEYCN
ncbi:MAG: hypothetical protein AB1650_04080 [Candidatus Omnitrophota bacterium]